MTAFMDKFEEVREEKRKEKKRREESRSGEQRREEDRRRENRRRQEMSGEEETWLTCSEYLHSPIGRTTHTALPSFYYAPSQMRSLNALNNAVLDFSSS